MQIYKEYEFYSPYISIFSTYPRLRTIGLMPPPPTPAERNRAYNLANPAPFVPPASIKEPYEAAEYQVSLLMACNFPKHPERQIKIFVETAVALVRLILVSLISSKVFILVLLKALLFPFAQLIAGLDEVYNMFNRFTNKFHQFADPRNLSYPPEVAKVLTFTEYIVKIRKRLSANGLSVVHDKRRAEFDDALEEARKTRVRPSSPVPFFGTFLTSVLGTQGCQAFTRRCRFRGGRRAGRRPGHARCPGQRGVLFLPRYLFRTLMPFCS